MYDSHNQMDEVVSNGYRGKCELKNEKLQNHDSVCGTGNNIIVYNFTIARYHFHLIATSRDIAVSA